MLEAFVLPEALSQTRGRKVYYLKSRWYLRGIGVVFLALGLLDGFFTAGVGILSGVFNGFSVYSLISTVFLIGLGAVYLWMAQSVYIATSPEGLTYSNMGVYTIQSSWANIDHVGPVKMRLFGNQRCLVIREPVHLGWLSGLAFALPKEQRERTIPLTGGWDRIPELIQDIRMYAPHVSGL
jgi:hypothetical protein